MENIMIDSRDKYCTIICINKLRGIELDEDCGIDLYYGKDSEKKFTYINQDDCDINYCRIAKELFNIDIKIKRLKGGELSFCD